MSDSDYPPRSRRWLIFLLPAVLLLALAATGFRLWDEHNPFWDRTSEYQEANELAATIHKRPLTDAEFGRALRLCETGNVHAREAAVSIVEESVRRNPERGEGAIKVMTRVAQARNPRLKESAQHLLKRLQDPPPAPK